MLRRTVHEQTQTDAFRSMEEARRPVFVGNRIMAHHKAPRKYQRFGILLTELTEYALLAHGATLAEIAGAVSERVFWQWRRGDRLPANFNELRPVADALRCRPEKLVELFLSAGLPPPTPDRPDLPDWDAWERSRRSVRASIGNLVHRVAVRGTSTWSYIGIQDYVAAQRGIRRLQALGGAARLFEAGRVKLQELGARDFEGNDARFIIDERNLELAIELFETRDDSLFEIDPTYRLKEELFSENHAGLETLLDRASFASIAVEYWKTARQKPPELGLGTSVREFPGIRTRRPFHIFSVVVPETVFSQMKRASALSFLTADELKTTRGGQREGVTDGGQAIADNLFLHEENEHDLGLVVLSALHRQMDGPSAEFHGWTQPTTVAQEVRETAEAVLDEFHALAAEGEVELNEPLPGLGALAKISATGNARLARIAEAKGAAALRPRNEPAAATRKAFQYDAFVSHASEDAAAFVDPLVLELERRGLRVWYDRDRMAHGDAMIEKINDGLRSSRCGVIVASPHYFGKVYTTPEISALVHSAMRDRARKVLPVLYQMSQDELFRVHPILANHINIEAAKHDPAEIANFVAAAVLPQDAASLAERVALDTTVDAVLRRVRDLNESPFVPGMHDAPYDALPEQLHLLVVRPRIQIAWYELDQGDLSHKISWKVTNVGAGDARDTAVFLPGIASYDAGAFAVGECKEEQRRFDDRYAYHKMMKPPVQAIVEFTDVYGNLYREYADVKASSKSCHDNADYTTTAFGHPYPVSGRIVDPDVEGDRFFLSVST